MSITLALVLSPVAAGQGLPCGYEVDFIYGPMCGPKELANAHGAGISQQPGDVCGWWRCPFADADHAFAWWGAGNLITLAIPGETESRATDIEAGRIVGHYKSLAQASGFRIENSVFTNIPTLPGGNNVEVARVNASGVIVGSWGNTVTPPLVFPRAFRWESGVMQDLQPVLMAPHSRAIDVNDKGAITGWMGQSGLPGVTTGFEPHAFIWQNGVVTDLGLMPGSLGTEGRGINNHHQVTGIAWFPAQNQQGFVRRGFFWDNGVFIDLGVWPGEEEVFPADIDDNGMIIGAHEGSAFIWSAGRMRLLTDMIIAGPYDYAELPRDIQMTGGMIAAGAGIWQGPGQGYERQAARLRPVLREPGDTNCDRLVDVTDFLAIITNWGASGVDADLNADFTVDVDDLLLVILNWG